MGFKIESDQCLVLKKNPYKAGHNICQLLLKNGKKISAIFYGSISTKANKSSKVIEVGHFIDISFKNKRLPSTEVYSISEWSHHWSPKNIRYDVEAFYLLCFYLEVLDKISTKQTKIYSENEIEDELLFKISANAIFYLDQSLKEKTFRKESHLCLFLVKIIYFLGFFPQINKCLFCDNELKNFKKIFLLMEQGGMTCGECFSQELKEDGFKGDFSDKELCNYFELGMKLKFKDFNSFNIPQFGENKKIFEYLCYQTALTRESFKTVKAIL